VDGKERLHFLKAVRLWLAGLYKTMMNERTLVVVVVAESQYPHDPAQLICIQTDHLVCWQMPAWRATVEQTKQKKMGGAV
jgi:hypothetical protein